MTTSKLNNAQTAAWNEFKNACKNGMLRICKHTEQVFLVSKNGEKFWFIENDTYSNWENASDEGVQYGEMEIPAEHGPGTETYFCAQQKNSETLAPVGEAGDFHNYKLIELNNGEYTITNK